MRNKTLNDLLRAARSRTAEPEIVSHEEAAELLRSHSMRSVPQSATIGRRLHQRLLSSPLKLGMTAMTAASLITIGMLTLPTLFAHHEASQPIAHRALVPNTSTQKPPDPPPVMEAAPVTAVVPMRPTEPTAPTPPTPATEPTAPVRIDSLQPYEIPTEKLADLGIKLDDNGDIDFFTKAKNGEIYRFGLPPSWGMRLHMGEVFTAADLDGLQIPKSAPRLVTAPNGAKRMFSFESDTSFTKFLAGQRMFVSMNQNTTIAQGDKLEGRPDTGHTLISRKMILTLSSDSTQSSPASMRMEDGEASSIKVSQNINSGVTVDVFGDSSLPGNRQRNIVRRITVDTNSVRFFNVVRTDSTQHFDNDEDVVKKYRRAGMPPNTFKFNSDSNGTTMFRLRMMVDSLHNVCGPGSDFSKQWREYAKLWSDSAKQWSEFAKRWTDSAKQWGDYAKQWQKFNSPKLWKHFNDSSFYRFRDFSPNSSSNNFNYFDSVWNKFSVSLDKLVPVRVRNLKDPEHPNELIFWYEPSQVKNILPERPPSRVAMAQPQHISLSAFPNPTTGPVTVHYESKDGEKAHLTVLNLLGQTVLDCGETSGLSGDHQIDLSSLEAGVYLLSSATEDGGRTVERIVVNK